jgi:hypothetical protein
MHKSVSESPVARQGQCGTLCAQLIAYVRAAFVRLLEQSPHLLLRSTNPPGGAHIDRLCPRHVLPARRRLRAVAPHPWKEGAVMATRIYIGHLPYSTNDQDLFTLFRSYGNVTEAWVRVDHATGQSQGDGFVEMPDDAAAHVAITRLNGYMLDHQSIQVGVAQPQAGGPGGRFGDDGNTRGRRR